MFSALTGVFQKILTLMRNQLHEHSKSHLQQVNKLAEADITITYSHNTNRLTSRSTSDHEASDKSGSESDDEDIDRQNRVSFHENDQSLYNEEDLTASFLPKQETTLSITTRKPDDDSLGSTLKQFSGSHNHDNENLG